MAGTTLTVSEADLAALASYQLTFAVGGDQDEPNPRVAAFRVGGALAHESRQLEKGADVTVTIADRHGNVICQADGYVSQVAFKEHRPKDGPMFTERAHTIRLHAEDD